MGEKKVVLDTNILISAFGWEGKPREIFKKILNREFELVISREQLEELQKVLTYPKFNFTESQRLRFFNIIFEIATLVNTSNKLDIIKDDPYDNAILESALENDVDFIISGDEHLLSIKQYDKVKIVTASEFLDLSIL